MNKNERHKQVQKQIQIELDILWENRELEPNEDKSDIDRVDFEIKALKSMLTFYRLYNNSLNEKLKNINSIINNN